MKYFKLFWISVIVFSVMLYCLSFLFPANTVVSRAVNVAGKKLRLEDSLPHFYAIAFQDDNISEKLKKMTDSIAKSQSVEQGEFISNQYQLSFKDTLRMPAPFANHIRQGVAIYDLSTDSTAVQVFYQIHVPWYKPWKKFGLMLNEAKYGPSLDSAISRIKRKNGL